MAREKNKDRQIRFDDYQLNEVSVRLVLSEAPGLYSASPIHTPGDAVDVMADMLKEMDRELFCVINLATNGQPINYHIVSMGSIDASVVPMPNVFKTAILENASAVVGLHNHPSGSVSPSPEDFEVTKRLVAAGELMGIRALDHIIVGACSGAQYSFRQEHPELFRTELSYDRLADLAMNGTAGCREDVTAYEREEEMEF